MNPVTGQGTRFAWGTAQYTLTAVSLQSGGGGGSEIDITSMSSKVVTDGDNTNKKFVTRDVDSAFAGAGDVSLSVDFLLDSKIATTQVHSAVGLKRQLVLTLPSSDAAAFAPGIKIESSAVLTQLSLGVSTGEYVSGSATFRLSGD